MPIRHPVLSNLYANLAEYQQVLFLDESYREPTKQSDKDGYYIIAGSVLTKDTLEGTRIRLREIVGRNYSTPPRLYKPLGERKPSALCLVNVINGKINTF